jgi:predicted nucleotidyltransferase
MNIEKDKIKSIIHLCKTHKVKELYIFGSAITKQFGSSSDVDFLVEFEGIDVVDYFDNYMDFKDKLENLLGRNIDLVENQAIRNPIFRQSVDRSKQLIYG